MSNNKIIAYQVPPEWQESPLSYDESAFEGLEIYGNRNYIQRTSDIFDRLPDILDTLGEEWENIELFENKDGYYSTCDDAVADNAPTRRNGEKYTPDECYEWFKIARKWHTTDEETQCFLDALRLITGREYAHATMRGCCQGDWQYIIFPTEYGREFVQTFEKEYFNEGTEWTIDEGDGDTYSMYCVTYNPRAEIAEVTGAAPENITLF